MISFVLRRLFAIAPSLLLFAIALFLVIAAAPLPPTSSTSEEHLRRFSHLPILVNLDPEDRPRVVATIVARLPSEVGESRRRDIDRLLRIGAAGLVDLVAALERLAAPDRARISRELAPLAFRMGLEDVADLENPTRAEGYFRRVLDARGPDLRPATVRRALRRHLSDPAEPLYARQIRNADTAVLAPIFDELDATSSAEEREELQSLAIAAARRAGAEVKDFAALQLFWTVHRADYVEYGTLERVAARITETRFGRWVVHAFTQRFGRSWRTNEPVLDDLRRRAPPTLLRASLALLLAYLMALPIGVLTAARRYGPVDRVTNTVLVLLHAFPAFVVALVARAASPRLARTDGFVIVALAIVALAPIARHLRSRLLEEAGQDYVTTARAMGVSPFTIWTRRIARNAIGPVIGYGAALVPLTLTWTLFAEEILALEGLGPAAIAAVRARDVPWLMAFSLFVAAGAALVLLLGDVLQAFNDPRVRRSLEIDRPEDA